MTPQPQDDARERERFEAKYQYRDMSKDQYGDYLDVVTGNLWLTWKAAKQDSALEVRELVDGLSDAHAALCCCHNIIKGPDNTVPINRAAELLVKYAALNTTGVKDG